VPFNRPIPDRRPADKAASALGGIMQAEMAMQMAMVLPSAVLIGWLLGALADRWFHQSWIGIAGVVFGSVSGLTWIIRLVLTAERNSRPGNSTGGGPAA
jgi:F0F1-type ATP synthase assembly protein I